MSAYFVIPPPTLNKSFLLPGSALCARACACDPRPAAVINPLNYEGGLEGRGKKLLMKEMDLISLLLPRETRAHPQNTRECQRRRTRAPMQNN